MAILAVQATIGDYAKWRSIFDAKARPLQVANGITNPRVYRNADNAAEILILADVADMAKARQALGSPEVRAIMHEAGVVGPPKVHTIEQ